MLFHCLEECGEKVTVQEVRLEVRLEARLEVRLEARLEVRLEARLEVRLEARPALGRASIIMLEKDNRRIILLYLIKKKM